MTYNITLTANHQSLTAEYLPLAAESVQYLTAKVICETEDWTGREIKAMFGQGCTVHEVTVTNGEITAKQQLNLSAGDWHVWLVGNSARDGEVIPRITTNIAHISVAPTGGTEGNPFPAIPPTVAEQLRADMGDLADLTTEDKSSLVAAINEAAESGGTADAVIYTPQTLTEEQKSQARTNIGAEKAGTAYTKPASGIPKSDLAEDVQTSLAKADTAISLGLTAAAPGQIIKVKAVQDGKPTEWEAVDMPGGEEWEYIGAVTAPEDVTSIYLTTDEDGLPYTLKKFRLVGKVYGNTNNSTGWIRVFNTPTFQLTETFANGLAANGEAYYSFDVAGEIIVGIPRITSIFVAGNSTTIKNGLSYAATHKILYNYAPRDTAKKLLAYTSLGISGYQAGVLGAGTMFEIYGVRA
jgi:hypothetical protein